MKPMSVVQSLQSTIQWWLDENASVAFLPNYKNKLERFIIQNVDPR